MREEEREVEALTQISGTVVKGNLFPLFYFLHCKEPDTQLTLDRPLQTKSVFFN